MSVDKVLRDMIRDEVESLIDPLVRAIQQLQSQGDLASKLSSLLGAKRGPGRPPKAAALVLGRKPGRKAGGGRKGRGGRERAEDGANDRPCAIQGCKRASRAKGYCSAHYQKLRMLARTNRLPADWKEFAAPQSVKDLKLPRGRAGAKALAAAKSK